MYKLKYLLVNELNTLTPYILNSVFENLEGDERRLITLSLYLDFFFFLK